MHFHNDVLINGRHLAPAPLEFDGSRYSFDPVRFERAIKNNTKIFILCNPHNPTGNVWSEDELRQMGEICARHQVLVISDEIHCDFVIGEGRKHIPFASLGQEFALNSVTCTSASKTFNLAGLQCASMIVPDRFKRDELRRVLERNTNARVNMLGALATEAAYDHGEAWVDNLVGYISANQAHFRDSVNSSTSRVKVLEMDSLYLAWIDCRELGLSIDELDNFLLTRAKVWFDRGPKFGVEGHGFMRANLACPRSVVDRSILQLVHAIESM
ncbi:MalY/PatB family protein [Achromobacter xylosoxidans]|uniref:MalY/PatB family protein n=1 Tax=Alcaligenes xylosoxydans xylosoxydans TaxID=85698 RepID=UPI0030CA2A74